MDKLSPYLDKILPLLEKLFEQLLLFLSMSWVQPSIMVLITYFAANWVRNTIPPKVRETLQKLKIKINPYLIEIAVPPLYYAVLLNGLGISVMFAPFTARIEGIIIATLKSLMIFIMMIFMLNLSKFLLKLAANSPTSFKIIRVETAPLFEKLNFLVIVLTGVYFISAAWNIDMTAILASAGIAGLAIGMAAKDTLSDIISGVLILTDSPFKVGDMITLTNGDKGRITNIGIRSTRIATIDRVEITIPNAELASKQIKNESGGREQRFRRFRVDVNIAYGTPMSKIQL